MLAADLLIVLIRASGASAAALGCFLWVHALHLLGSRQIRDLPLSALIEASVKGRIILPQLGAGIELNLANLWPLSFILHEAQPAGGSDCTMLNCFPYEVLPWGS
jgi:hypothetical protein